MVQEDHEGGKDSVENPVFPLMILTFYHSGGGERIDGMVNFETKGVESGSYHVCMYIIYITYTLYVQR